MSLVRVSYHLGSGCGSVGRAVARGPQFESSHRQFYTEYFFIDNSGIVKTKIKKKRLGMELFKKVETLAIA